MRKSKCHWLQRGVSPPILTFDLGLKTPKCHGCCHQTVFCFPFFSFLCVFSCHMGLLQSVHQIQDKHPHHQPALSPTVPFALCLCLFHFNGCLCLFGNTMLSESLCLAAQADPLQPSCEYVYMNFTQEPR